MKAIVYSEHGGPEVLRYTEAPEPEIDAYEVLVRVRACALNHLDLFLRRGLPGIEIPLPHIPGSDIAGEVAKIGAKVKEEAAELAQAFERESDERVASEAADVLYHLLVGLRARTIPLRRVLEELARRIGKSGHEEKASRTA